MTLLDFTICDELNDVGGCMIKCDCDKKTQELRANVGCFIPIEKKHKAGR
jgi:hypothetical protein